MATIGRNRAVADLRGRAFMGFPAWLLWNRIFVLINWAWDYFFYERAVRLILPSSKC